MISMGGSVLTGPLLLLLPGKLLSCTLRLVQETLHNTWDPMIMHL